MTTTGFSMATVKPLLTGLAFVESPRWHDGCFWFSDWGAQEIIAVDLEGNDEVIVRDVRSFPFCLGFLPDGRLLIIADKRLFRRELDGSLATHADLTDFSKQVGFAEYGWNDIVVDGRGNAYINNGGDGFRGGLGIIALVTADGSVRQVADGLAFPNGMVVTPNNTTLIVAESMGKRLTAFDIAPNGDLSNRRVWAELEGFGPDGICLDVEGAVWCGSGQRCVRVREGGEVLQVIDLDLFCTACALGGPDHKTLLMTVIHWREDATMKEIGIVQQALKAGTPAVWPGERTAQVLTVQVVIPGVG
jgi:sugar lactone lactonase YvrE